MRTFTSTDMEINGQPDSYVEGYVVYSTDKRFGEDADGNRAVSRTVVEDVEEITAFDIGGEEINLDQDDVERASQLLTQKFLEG